MRDESSAYRHWIGYLLGLEIRSVAVGYGEVDLARGPEIARSETSEGSPEGTAPSPAYCCVVVVSALYSPAES